MSRAGWLRVAVAAVATAVAIAACEKVPLTAPAGTSMFLQANPTFVVANGGTSVVTALLTEPAGTLVPDGTVVLFFTNLGYIDPRGETVDGVARVNFVADSRSGTATITAWSGGGPTTTPTTTLVTQDAIGSSSVTITIGSALPKRIVVTADPQRLTVSTGRQSSIVANVFDGNGNPVQNVPIIFSVSASTLEETLDSGGAPQFTDSNGRAFDTLRTRAVFGGTQKTVTVTANAPIAIENNTVSVFVN
jgi:hypothetical protein